VLEVQASLGDGPLESLDGNTGQFELLIIALVLADIADHRVEDLTNLLLVELLVDILVQELTEVA